jgi:hypothetical protein
MSQSMARRLGKPLAAITAVALTASLATARTDNENPFQLTSELIRKGLTLVSPGPILEANVRVNCSIRLPFVGTLGGDDPLVSLQKEKLELEKQKAAIIERIGLEQNDILKKQLEVMRDQLQVNIQRNELLAEQARSLRQLGDIQIQAFKYQKEHDEALLRKADYSFPSDTLVVVVADFSSGNLDEGREIADEIAHHLNELKKYGIKIHVLTGEIKPGVIIRSAEMARDVGRHFPPQTDFVVIWGSMSPRTVGRYRPHLTCVQKITAERGASVTFDIDLESKDLPPASDKEKYRQECYNNLIGFTCAAIPSCYAAHEIGQDRIPELGKFYDFLGDTPEVKKYRKDLEPLTRWARAIASPERKVRRVTEISSKEPYPLAIVNEKDGSVMVLITDEAGKPKPFKNTLTGKEEIVYIDVLETTVGQFVAFLNEKGNRDEGGATWYHYDAEGGDIIEEKGVFRSNPENRFRAAISDVNWIGAQSYCEWAGKELPTVKVWQAAAAPAKKGPYPWGDGFDNPINLCHGAFTDRRFNGKAYNTYGGRYPKDLSRIGCYDMAGNVAEWCYDKKDPNKGNERCVCCGSFNDSNAELFKISSVRHVPEVTHQRWVGFRGVIRLPLDEPKP